MDSTVYVAIISAIVGPIAILVLKDYLDNRKKSHTIEKSIDSYKKVGDELEEIFEEMEADRVWMVQFHNGGNFYPTGKSIQKFSMFYETTRSSQVPRIQQYYQNIPVSIFNKAFSQISKAGEILIEDRKDESIPTYGLKYAMEDASSVSAYLFRVETIDERFVAVIGVDFIKKKSITQEQLNKVRIKVAAMGGLVSNYLK
jgi:hypothetical protein